MVRCPLPFVRLRTGLSLLALLSLDSAAAISLSTADNWTVRSSTFEGRCVQDIASGDGLSVAISYEPGEGSRLLLSGDGRNYEEVYRLDGPWLAGITYGGGRFVAVGDEGRVVTSIDGQFWTGHTAKTTHSLRSVAYGNGQYVAIGAPGRFLASGDGESWSEVGPLFDSTYRDITFGGGRFVAVSGSGKAAVSTDGLSWTETAMPAPTLLRSIVYGVGNFVAVGSKRDASYGRGDIWVSPDGESWTRHAVEEARGFLSAGFGNGLFVVGGRDGEIFTSSDGQLWTRSATWRDTWIHGVTAHDDAFLVSGAPGLFLGPIPVFDQFSNWREQGHFTVEELGDPSVSGPQADPGGFGIPNLVRYALGLDPVAPDRERLPKMTTAGPAPNFTFGWLSDAADLTLAVDRSSDLSAWEAVDESALQRSAYGRFERVELTVSPEDVSVFFRLDINTIE